MKADDLKEKWHRDLGNDTIREMNLDDKRLNERCQYRKQCEDYSRCDLSDNICIEDTGNSDFDIMCGNNTTREEK